MKLLNSKTILPILCGTLLATTGFCFSATSSQADTIVMFTNASSSYISVVAYDNNGEELNLTSTQKNVSVNGDYFGCQSVDWKDIRYFEINFNGSYSLEFADTYNYQYSVIWNPTEVQEDNSVDFINDRIEQLDFYSQSTTSTTNILNSVRFYIADTLDVPSNSFVATQNLKNAQKKTGKWGIYQFVFTCNGNTFTTNLFEVKATNPNELNQLLPVTIRESITRSKYSINNAYVLSLDKNDYYYVNHEKLVWKIKGVSSEGEKYVLLPEDITADEIGKTKSIIADNSFDRTGTSFTFDFEIAGDWEITCEVKNSENETIKTSNSIHVSTVKVVESYVYILVIAGAVVVAGILLAIIIIRSKKKERIW